MPGRAGRAGPPHRTPAGYRRGDPPGRGHRCGRVQSARGNGIPVGQPRADAGQRTGALDLATELGFEPAPLSLAAAAIASTGLDCRRYLGYFGERRQALGGAAGGQAAASLAAAWSLSCELAGQLGPGGMARRVLALISMLAPQGVPGAEQARQDLAEAATVATSVLGIDLRSAAARPRG